MAMAAEIDLAIAAFEDETAAVVKANPNVRVPFGNNCM